MSKQLTLSASIAVIATALFAVMVGTMDAKVAAEGKTGAPLLLLGDRDRAQHGQQDRHAVALRAFDAAQHVRLGHVRDLVSQHAGHLVLGVRHQHQSGIDADVAAHGGKGVDLAVLHHEEGEVLPGVVAGGGKPVAQPAQPGVDQRILEDVVVVAQLAQHHLAIRLLVRGTEHRPGGRADVRQARALLRGRAQAGDGEHQGGDGNGQAHGDLFGGADGQRAGWRGLRRAA